MASELATVARGVRKWVFGAVQQDGPGRYAATPEEIQRMLLAEAMGGSTILGPVSDGQSLRVAAVYACVRLLSDSIGMLPASLFKKDGDKHTIDETNTVHALICVRPNGWQTAYEFWRLAMMHILMRGNFYALKALANKRVTGLVPLDPTQMRVKQDDAGVLTYLYTRPRDGTVVTFSQEEIFHVRGLTADGVVGLSVLEAARNSIGVSIRTEQHGATLFSKGATPSGSLEVQGELSLEAYARLRKDFEENYAGSENAHRVMILEQGAKFSPISMSAVDSQFIESRKFTRSEIAMFFGVPPHAIGDVERGTSWGSGIEQQNIGFLIHTLMPYIVNIQQACIRDLIPLPDQTKFVVKFDTDLLTKADFVSRQNGLQVMRRNGVLSANDWRKAEGFDPIEGAEADSYVTVAAAGGTPAAPPSLTQ